MQDRRTSSWRPCPWTALSAQEDTWCWSVAPSSSPPIVISRKAADQGLCLSIFDRLHHALGEHESA
eukprot:5343427-Pyramimonas_sp.AAC.1